MKDSRHNGHGNGHGHITETPDVSHIKNIDVTHEASDVSVGGILKFVVGLTVFAIVVHVLMWGLFRFFNSQEEGKEPSPGPMAMTEQERRPPDPKLQAAPGFGVKLENGQWVPLENREPQAEYRALLGQWQSQLKCERTQTSDVHHPEAENSTSSQPCVPIDQAMQKVLEGKGLPSRPQAETNQTGAAGDYGIDMPTAASSARMTEKRR
ncbi:MAG TPA: hypothetical protein VHR36_13940 [Pyrinomonadaceae bacterium]|jgi:hypothetical protein|nr:hypothetical protein [Pyrinomonadaceae bacterium]